MKTLAKFALLHGWATDPGIWQSVEAELESVGCPVRLYEMPGYGSRHPESGTISFSELVDDAIEQLSGVDVWIGWSLGAMVSLAAASRYPGLLRGVFAVSATSKFCCDEEKELALTQLRSSVEKDPAKAVKRFHRSMPAPNHRREVTKQLADLDAPAKETLLAGLDMLLRTDLSGEVNKITCPTTIVSGEQDQIIPASSGESLQQLIAGSQYTALPCGHLPFLECHQKFMEQLFEFARTNSTSTAD